jgi:hypothetical protein
VGEELAALVPLLFGVVLIPAVTLPLTRQAAAGRLEPNDVMGIRTRHTRASTEAWVAGHAAALPRLQTCVPIALTTVLTSILAQLIAGVAWGMALALTGFLVETAVLASAVGPANRAAKAATEAERAE